MKHSTALRYLHAINMNICAMNTRFIYMCVYIQGYYSQQFIDLLSNPYFPFMSIQCFRKFDKKPFVLVKSHKSK